MEGKRIPGADEVNKASKALGTTFSSAGCSYVHNTVNKQLNLCIDRKNDNHKILDKLNILYTNADCFSNKKSYMMFLLSSLNFKPSIIIITEVNPKVSAHKQQESEFNITGYNMFCSNVGIDHFRGIIIYVDNNIACSELELVTDFSECLFVQIRDNSKVVLNIGAVYRSPSSSTKNDSNLNNLINHVCSHFSGDFVLLGDFNYRNINWDTWTSAGSSCLDSPENKFIDCLQYNLLLQHVQFPTRARGTDSPHTLDLIISNGDFVSDILNMSPLGKSDHSVIQCTCNLSFSFQRAKKFNLNKGNYAALRDNVSYNLNHIVEYININTEWCSFKKTIDDAVSNFIPYIASDTWKKKSSWKFPLPRDSVKLINRKHRLWARFQETKDKKIEVEYKKIRNLVRKETRKVTKNKQYEIAKSCKLNPKKFWQYVNSKTRTHKSVGTISILNADGSKELIEEDLAKANVFANYFVKVYTNEGSENFSHLQEIMPPNSMPKIYFSEDDIKQKLSSMKINKSPGPDMLHPRVFKELQNVIVGKLKQIFEHSLEDGEIPEDWKTSTVTVIYKKGKKDCVENYRPISLTCITCKLMESLIRDQVMQFFMHHKLFSCCQYGFINGRSTMLQLLKIMDEWTSSLEAGGQIDVIYTDYEKAFDKVPHKRLLSKLCSYGLPVELIKWIEAFLCSRTQRVRINGAFSEKKPVLSGIPQGSVLGPLLFIIFINDLPGVCEELSRIFLFADDSKLYKHITTEGDYLSLKQSCQNMFNWSEQWLMRLNTAKCKVLTITKNSNNIHFYDYGFTSCENVFISLDHVDNMKDLGIIVDSELNFLCHIKEKVNKAYQMLGIINRNFRDVDKSTFLLLYLSLVRSQLEYCNSVWNPYKVGSIALIERVQKRATKMISSCKKLSYIDRLKYLHLPTMKFRRLRGDMIETYKILNGFYDTDVVPSLPRNYDSRTRGNSLKLLHMRPRYDLRKYYFSSRVVGAWNALPDSVVLCQSINSFKNNLDKCWKNEELFYNWEACWIGSTI